MIDSQQDIYYNFILVIIGFNGTRYISLQSGQRETGEIRISPFVDIVIAIL